MEAEATIVLDRELFEDLYARYNRREFVHPDPVGFLYRFENPRDREIAGLIAACLAYGRVGQIHASVDRVLDPMPSPSRFLQNASPDTLLRTYGNFRHRFASGEDLACLLLGAKRILDQWGSLEACFASGLNGGGSARGALCSFVEELTAGSSLPGRHLVPSPSKGSACKRLHLFLRWMVRRDRVDPGGWTAVTARSLVVPLDTHMHRFGLALGLTRRRQADARAAGEITAAFATIAPEDPVRYDFALTRLAIRGGGDLHAFVDRCKTRGHAK